MALNDEHSGRSPMAAAACSQPEPTATPEPEIDLGALKQEVVANYAEGVHASYARSLASARAMEQAIRQWMFSFPALLRRLWKRLNGPG